jgi:GAF domain-containing protein
MATLEMPVNEVNRIEALKKHSILDTPPDGSFDRITELAAAIFNVPIAIISLVDTDRIWFKSHFGLSINQLDRDPGLCASAILSDEAYVIENAIEDVRSLANPLVAGEFGLRFYAATPLQTEDHYNLGTLCIIDKMTRTFNEEQKEILKKLGRVVMDEMESRIALRNVTENIKTLASEISSHLKSTITNIESSPDDQKTKTLSYLESSRLYMMNIQNQLNQL